ncbi:hypothetical protein BGZ61DRAFT_485538 [Ilyonectria robusta]|uniref:uncharacterized protein n=1 Tax=Ilyonectria robusta TaxID=1079257 RepID=UPI001E8CB4B9|nr:uncharacterized protein BGZ61DRAFT_485538 [Ilyonectria robusta]KAH8661192.1 hypothetical protein BGZ61DRAFT_485538 [Ilyonectria robusta]
MHAVSTRRKFILQLLSAKEGGLSERRSWASPKSNPGRREEEFRDADWLSLVSAFEKENYKMRASPEACGFALSDKELLEKNGLLSGSLGLLELVVDLVSVLHDMETSWVRFHGVSWTTKVHDPAIPNGTVHESVLKNEADWLPKSGYVSTSEVPTEVLERRLSGHEFCHLVVLEDSQEHHP